MLTPSINTGVAEDTRTPAQRSKDYSSKEVLPALGDFDYRTLPTTSQFGYSVRNQGYGNTCVANAGAKCLEILDKQTTEMYSTIPIYKPRMNSPYAGMIGADALSIICNKPMTYERVLPSQLLTDSQVDATDTSGILTVGNPTNYYVIGYDNLKFDDIASAVLTHGCAIIYVNTNKYTYTSVPNPGPRDNSLRHGVAAVQVIWDPQTEQPYLIIEDSWGKFDNQTRFNLKPGHRAFSKAFVESNVYFAGGLMNFKYAIPNQVIIPKGSMTFPRVMNYGETSEDIKNLQKKLMSLSLFPVNIPTTGYYGNVTAKAVYNYQVRYNVAPIAELNYLKGRTVGPKTLAALNTL